MQSAFIDRAKHARASVGTVPNAAKGDYLNAVKGLPAEIRLIGLGQALATLRADDKSGHQLVYRHVEDWVLKHGGIYTQMPNNPPFLLHAVIGDDPPGQQLGAVQDRYRLAVAEIDAYLAILKRLAEVFLGDKAPEQQTNGQQPAAAR